MQPPTPEAPAEPVAPAAPDAPAGPAPAAPATTLSQSAAPSEALPRTAQEVDGLRIRRETLRDQLERATNRRSNLVAELDRAREPEARAGVQQRLNLLDERILQIERDQALTERLLSSAPPAVLANTAQRPRPEPMVPEDEAAALSMGTFAIGVVLTLLVSRFRRRRARNAPPPPALAADPRIDRLSQAVDAIAEEVERIGEGQRFMTHLLAERQETPALGAEVDRR